jgi:BirA family biotin operon repressor/biotin-[acetyl-CoA-carboxylase] ligase
VSAMLKWPNDVVIGDRKLAGLLVERVEDATGATAVIGIGLNVTATAAELPTPQATSLALEGASMTDRSTLVKAVLRRLDGLLAEWERHGGEPGEQLRGAYVAACATVGQQVRIDLPGGATVIGEAVGIDDAGRLLVHTESGQQSFGAGDVMHVRRPA